MTLCLAVLYIVSLVLMARKKEEYKKLFILASGLLILADGAIGAWVLFEMVHEAMTFAVLLFALALWSVAALLYYIRDPDKHKVVFAAIPSLIICVPLMLAEFIVIVLSFAVMHM